MVRIVCICGISSPIRELNWKSWKREIEHREDYTGSYHLVPYHHLDREAIEAVIDDTIADIIDNATPTILLGHSYGGIIARAVESRLQGHEAHDHIRGLITLMSPHQMPAWYGGIGKVRDTLHIPATPSVPYYSFGGYLDLLVPYAWTHLCPKKSHHTDLFSEHISIMYSSSLQEAVWSKIEDFSSLEPHTVSPKGNDSLLSPEVV